MRDINSAWNIAEQKRHSPPCLCLSINILALTPRESRGWLEHGGLHAATVVSPSLPLGTLSLTLGAEVGLQPGEKQVPCFPGALHPCTLLRPCTPVQNSSSSQALGISESSQHAIGPGFHLPTPLGGQGTNHYCFRGKGLGPGHEIRACGAFCHSSHHLCEEHARGSWIISALCLSCYQLLAISAPDRHRG